MSQCLLEPRSWSQAQFQDCQLGDSRRTERLVRYAQQMAEKPEAPTTQQAELWSDCKAAYRLFSRPEVTFDAVVEPHHRQTQQLAPGTYLVISDTTELDFGYLRDVPGLGRVGGTQHRGFFLHSALVVAADEPRVIGLAAQELFTRPIPKVPRVGSAARKQRVCETAVWRQVMERVRPAGDGVKLIHVCDRGADNFEVFCQIHRQQAGCVIRAAQRHRIVQRTNGRADPLQVLLEEAAVLGTYQLSVTRNHGQSSRTAQVEVRSVALVLPRPRSGVSQFVRDSGVPEIPLSAVEVRERHPPPNETALQWVLYTTEPAATFRQAWRVIEFYERRPVIEEFHQGLKTGCRVESRQYRHADRLAPVIGLIGVQAVRLLQLRELSRREPNRPAAEVVPAAWIKTLRTILRRPRPLDTVREVLHAVASLGGFLGRRHDGEPGWKTLWCGLETLLIALRAWPYQRKCG